MQKLSSVLLVDDDSTANYLNERLLRSLGVTDELLVAHDGAEALAVLARACAPPRPACPALVLLDVNMPVMNGIEFLEAYQPSPPAQQLVIVVLTTSTHASELAYIRTLPIAGIVCKPLTKEKVNTLLQEHFHRQLPAASL